MDTVHAVQIVHSALFTQRNIEYSAVDKQDSKAQVLSVLPEATALMTRW